ncbi:MAG: CvpA family protein [Rhodospirillales bacterium]|nr:CvpA family protein [Alphaproteobacteria bacterium]MBL6947543.1 CvpA family protein [Rhodospirillales bacterium]
MDKLAADAIATTSASGIGPLDVGVGVLLLISAILAYARGLVQEVLSIAGWIGATFATFYGFPYLRPYAREFTSIDIVADFGAGIIIFVTALVILSLMTRRISKVVKSSALSAIDRSLGFLFGLARGALIVVVAYIGLGMFYPEDDQPGWIREARSLELIKPGAVLLASLIPENLGAITWSDNKDSQKTPAEKAAKKTKDLSGPRRVIKDLMPRPKSGNTQDPNGYRGKDLKDMDRLHENIQNQ